MLYGYGRAPDAVWTVAGDTSPAIVTDVRIDNGQPSEPTIIESIASNTPATTHYFDLRATWTSARPVWLAALLNLGGVPAGALVHVTGRRPADGGFTYALGGNSLTQRTAVLPDGRVQLPSVFDSDLDELVGLQWRFFNDRSGATWANETTEISIGEGGAWSAVQLDDVARGRRRGRTRNTIDLRSLEGGAAIVGRREWRSTDLQIGPSHFSEAQGGGLSQGLDWESLAALMDAESARCLVVPQRFDEVGAFDATAVHRQMLFGRAEWGDTEGVPGPYVRTTLRIVEVR